MRSAIDKRIDSLLSSMRNRCAEKKDKNGRVRRRGIEFTVNRAGFVGWLQLYFSEGLRGVCRCEYCNAPVDVLSFSPDHATPLSRGGSSGLENVAISCERCNQAKGKLTAAEFKAFLGCMDRMRSQFIDGIAVRDIMHRLASARKAANSLNFMRAKEAKKKAENEF